MKKMKKITYAAVAAMMLVIALCASFVYAADDATAKFSEKLLEYYAANDTEVKLYIHCEDTVDFALIEAQAAERATEEVEKLREEGSYTEEQLQKEYDKWYDILYDVLRDNAYKDLATQLQTALGLEDRTTTCYREPTIFGYFTYEEALVIAENELVVSLTRAPEIESGKSDVEIETEYSGTEPPDDDTESGDITEDVGTEDWDDGTVPDETDPEPSTDSTEPTDPTEPPTDAPDLLVGDVDEDGLITATDASNILILAAEMGLGYEPTFEELYAADYNADGNADATDASLILIFAAEEGARS